MNTKVVAIFAIAILAAAGAGVAVYAFNGNQENGEITIVDGSGKTVTLSAPPNKVAVLNTNIPRAMMMLGISDKICCYHYGSNTFGIEAEKDSTNKLGTYYTPSVEKLLQKKVEVVLCPVSSMTIYTSVQTACENVGIKVIRLDCNGSTISEDLIKLSKIFGNPASATNALAKYNNDRDTILNAITSKLQVDAVSKETFLCVFSSRDAIYNQTSALSDTFKTIFSDNVTSMTDLPTTGVTNTINDGCIEAIREVESQVNNLIVRATSGDVSSSEFLAHYNNFVGDSKLIRPTATVATSNDVYVVANALCSGLYAPIGILLMAEKIYGIEVSITLDLDGEKTYTGLDDISSLITDFQKCYHLVDFEDTNVLMTQCTTSGTAADTIVYSA